jgi:hypothetical protein
MRRADRRSVSNTPPSRTAIAIGVPTGEHDMIAFLAHDPSSSSSSTITTGCDVKNVKAASDYISIHPSSTTRLRQIEERGGGLRVPRHDDEQQLAPAGQLGPAVGQRLASEIVRRRHRTATRPALHSVRATGTSVSHEWTAIRKKSVTEVANLDDFRVGPRTFKI